MVEKTRNTAIRYCNSSSNSEQQERQGAEEAETAEEEERGRGENHMIHEQMMRTHNAAGGQRQGGAVGALGGGVQPLNVGTVARSTSVVLE